MNRTRRLCLALKAVGELGPRQVGLYAWYQLCLRSGYFKRTMKAGGRNTGTDRQPLKINPCLELPGKSKLLSTLGKNGLASLIAEADEIVNGEVRLFGGPPVPLEVKPIDPLLHWTAYELGMQVGHGEDAKFIWEPGRFGWALALGRAYYLSGDERYAEAFWNFTETFLEANPLNMGLQWASAQEVALRLVAMTFASQVIARSSSATPVRMEQLAEAIAHHAGRIPPTTAYARAQNNNHLLIEAVGLYTAGIVLPDHPDAHQWRESGWRWFNRALQTQIADDGTYVQHSTNYHRLMLQAALWVRALAAKQGESLPPATIQRLSYATRWLVNLLDLNTGQVPNLGPNDSANILPISECPHNDYRTVLQAASIAFLGKPLFDEGLWDEMGLWLHAEDSRLEGPPSTIKLDHASPHVLRSSNSWAYLRIARFSSRPGHADQLHLDLWWRSYNVTQDPGTFRYNASPPWDNMLSRTGVHNTLTVNSQDQMTHAGRFLWLDWAQGELISREEANDGSWERLIGRHNGYRRLNVFHQREVTVYHDDRWSVEDRLIPIVTAGQEANEPISVNKPSTYNLPTYDLKLHWLLPDWSWGVENRKAGVEIRLESPYGPVILSVKQAAKSLSNKSDPSIKVQIVRAGELIYGSGEANPTRGWASHTYGYKMPALSFSVEVEGTLPLMLVSEWRFPVMESK